MIDPRTKIFEIKKISETRHAYTLSITLRSKKEKKKRRKRKKKKQKGIKINKV